MKEAGHILVNNMKFMTGALDLIFEALGVHRARLRQGLLRSGPSLCTQPRLSSNPSSPTSIWSTTQHTHYAGRPPPPYSMPVAESACAPKSMAVWLLRTEKSLTDVRTICRACGIRPG
jgi:hypothetical protein